MQVPSFTELVVYTEKILSESLGGEAVFKIYDKNNEALLTEIISIDHQKFREDLRYDIDELRLRFNNPGFFCLVLYLDEKPIAFDYGYNDSEVGKYFSDSSATLIERKGIGGFLGILELVYLFEKGYDAVNFTTEKLDESGRPLQQIWENMGYKTVSVTPSGSVNMTLEITPEVVEERAQKIISRSQA